MGSWMGTGKQKEAWGYHAYVMRPPYQCLKYKVWRGSGSVNTSTCREDGTHQFHRVEPLVIGILNLTLCISSSG